MNRISMFFKVSISVFSLLAIVILYCVGGKTSDSSVGESIINNESEKFEDVFVFNPEEISYDGTGDLDLLKGVSLKNYSLETLKDIVFIRISTGENISRKVVEDTADIDEGDKTLFDLDNLVSIFLVGVFNLLECACGIDIVAWIYSHGVAMEGSHVGDIGIEVHVGDDRCRISSRLQFSLNILHVLRLAPPLCGKSDELATGTDYPLCLVGTCCSVEGVGSGHRLHTDGVVATHEQRAYLDNRRLATRIATYAISLF